MISLFGVKICILLFVLTFLWIILVKIALSNVSDDEMWVWKRDGNYPWWYLTLGYLLLADILALLYIVIYILFVAW